MELKQLKEQTLTNNLEPLYVFTGPEIAIMDIYIQQIAKTKGAVIKRCSAVSSIFSKVQNNSFLNKPLCYIIYDDKQYTNEERAWDTVKKAVGDNIIILIYTNLDKRSKFYKAHQDVCVEFEKLSDELLIKYIGREIDLDTKYRQQLINFCANDYSRILLECDKLKHLMKVTGLNADQAFQLALKDKVIYVEPKDAIFEFVDSVCRRNIKTTYDLLEDTKLVNESPLALISVLYNNFRQMLLVQGAGNCPDICDKTGLTPFQVKLARDKGQRYSVSELTRALRIIREAERGIKTGTIEQDIAVDYILINIL